MRFIRIPLIILLAALFLPALGEACQVAAISLTFGRYDSLGSSGIHGTGQITVTCTGPAIIKLGPGQNSGGNFSPRKMRVGAGAGELHYNLYLDPSQTRVWGDGFSNTYTQTVMGGTSRLNIYGSIPARQKVRAGVYQDLMMVTVEW